MRTDRLILFSGMGGDSRLYRHIRIPEVEMVTPDHVPPEAGESLPQYAARIAEGHKIQPGDVVGGISFGGMIAGEIANQRPVAGLILLGSCLRPSRFPLVFRWAERVGRFVPDFVFAARSWSPLLRWRFAPIDDAAAECLADMARNCPMSQIRAFGRMALDWPGAENLTCPVLSVHGDWDRVIPLSFAEPGIVLKDAGHAFTLTHVPETVAAVRKFIGL